MEMDRKRDQATKSIQIEGDHVRCQKCGSAVKLLSRTNSYVRQYSRLRVTLENRIQWIKANPHRAGLKADSVAYHEAIKNIKDELAQLQEIEAKADALRRIPLYYIRSGKYVCSNCFEKRYSRRLSNR